MSWNELIAEARAAGVLAFCADGVAVLVRDSKAVQPATTEEKPNDSDQ
jgi:hypothetical protein